jgi:hypothetical protein
MTALNHALRYARGGLPVLPIWPALKFERGLTCGCGKGSRCAQPAKHPLGALVRNGCKDATLDDKKIADWFTAWPNANVGIATGDGIVVLDIDPRHGGDQALAELEAEHGELPVTWRVKTGGGGYHLFFYTTPGVQIRSSAGALGPGLDVRAQGSYVVAPRSTHVSGGVYFWERDIGSELASLPTWLHEKMVTRSKKKAAPVETWRTLTRDGVGEGQRNDAAARLAGYLLRHWIDPVVALELVQSWNLARCSPPLAPEEIAAVVNSVCGLELERRKGL